GGHLPLASSRRSDSFEMSTLRAFRSPVLAGRAETGAAREFVNASPVGALHPLAGTAAASAPTTPRTWRRGGATGAFQRQQMCCFKSTGATRQDDVVFTIRNTSISGDLSRAPTCPRRTPSLLEARLGNGPVFRTALARAASARHDPPR